MTLSRLSRIEQARQETREKLDEALSYSYNLQKPEQIKFYQEHLAHLDRLSQGLASTGPKADMKEWNRVRCDASPLDYFNS